MRTVRTMPTIPLRKLKGKVLTRRRELSTTSRRPERERRPSMPWPTASRATSPRHGASPTRPIQAYVLPTRVGRRPRARLTPTRPSFSSGKFVPTRRSNPGPSPQAGRKCGCSTRWRRSPGSTVRSWRCATHGRRVTPGARSRRLRCASVPTGYPGGRPGAVSTETDLEATDEESPMSAPGEREGRAEAVRDAPPGFGDDDP